MNGVGCSVVLTRPPAAAADRQKLHQAKVHAYDLHAVAALDQRAQPQLNRWHRRKSRMPKQMAAAMTSQSRRVLVMQTLCQVMTVQDHRDAAEQDQGIPFRPISQARA